MHIILLSIFFITSLFSENYIDKLHHKISKNIVKVSAGTDNFIAEKIGLFSQNAGTDLKTEINKEDTFFRSNKYIEETLKSFIRVSVKYDYNSLYKNNFNINIHANIDLKRSSKNLKLFISDLNNNNVNLPNINHYKEGNTAIGVSLMERVGEYFNAKYSFGIRSLYPFVKARFFLKNRFGKFQIEPVQTLQYSTKDHFKETTKLYLDSFLKDNLLFRTELGRGSRSEYNGMDYDVTFHLFWTMNSKSGFVLTQAFYGNTKYEYITNKISREQKKFNGINNYLTQLSYRQNI
ncbi:MAG: hypothetical protein QM482_01165 [Sulfurospirillum sp.]